MNQSLTKLSSDLLIDMLLTDRSPITKCAVICEMVKRGKHNSQERDALMQEIKNKDEFWNDYLVSDFAFAALHLLHWKKYDGDRIEVNQLIKSELVFD